MTTLPNTLASLFGELAGDRTSQVPRDVVAVVSAAIIPATIPGMLYAEASNFLAKKSGPWGEGFCLGANETEVPGYYVAKNSGLVLHVSPLDEKGKFVNSSVEAFAEFMRAWNSFISMQAPRRGGDIDEDKVISLGKKLKRKLKRSDKAAFANEDNWWSLVFEDVEYGILGPE